MYVSSVVFLSFVFLLEVMAEEEERVGRVLVYFLSLLVARDGGAGLEVEVHPLAHRGMCPLVLLLVKGNYRYRLGTGHP